MYKRQIKSCFAKLNIATGTLDELEAPGHFSQVLYFDGLAGPPVDYNVIYLDETSAIEYDCNEHDITTDYCIHIMSRTPTMTNDKLQELLDFAGRLKRMNLFGKKA